MKQLDLNGKRIFLLGGPGGVGKTTLAASLGVRFAQAGHRTVVLTVDPARRLAQALGIEKFSSELQAIPIPGLAGEPKLFASMLDTQRYFDKIIARFATNPEQREKLLNHRLYRIMVDHLGGTHEYAAMERLLEFTKDPSFDRIIVDTPPSQNAAELLSAPQRLADFMDNSVFRWFQGKQPVFSLFKQGTKMAFKVLEKLFGSEFLQALTEVLTDFEGMQNGFRERHLEIVQLLKSKQTLFLLVTFPSEVRFQETKEFLTTLHSLQIPLGALILNRVDRIAPPPVSLEQAGSETATKQINSVIAYYDALRSQQVHWIGKFEKHCPTLPLFQVERQNERSYDLAALAAMCPFEVK